MNIYLKNVIFAVSITGSLSPVGATAVTHLLEEINKLPPIELKELQQKMIKAPAAVIMAGSLEEESFPEYLEEAGASKIFQPPYQDLKKKSMTFNEAWKKPKRFNDDSLSELEELKPDFAYQLRDNPEMAQQLTNSWTLQKLKRLDLSNQGIDDLFMWNLGFRSPSSYLNFIDLSNNPKITDSSLKEIGESAFIGSILEKEDIRLRDALRPGSEVVVKVSGTGISAEEITDYEISPYNLSFRIRYVKPGEDPWKAKGVHGVKWVTPIL